MANIINALVYSLVNALISIYVYAHMVAVIVLLIKVYKLMAY